MTTPIDDIRAALKAATPGALRCGTKYHLSDEVRRLADSAPAWLAELCDRVEAAEGKLATCEGKLATCEKLVLALEQQRNAADQRVRGLEETATEAYRLGAETAEQRVRELEERNNKLLEMIQLGLVPVDTAAADERAAIVSYLLGTSDFDNYADILAELAHAIETGAHRKEKP